MSRNRKLRPTSISMLLGAGLVAGVTVFSLTSVFIRSGANPVPIPFWLFLVPLVIGAVVIGQAWLVRQYRKGRRPVDQLYAARIWVLTQATSRGGTLMAGGALGIAVAYYAGSATFLTDNGHNALLAGLASIVMTIEALVGERWCTYDDPGPDAAASANGVQ
ncbi:MULTISPECIES: DUF3180 domain-containing protein [Trueperella]|uniref:DUF3180 domain-containing protein n=1 Tax=Trueperella abortisuis TaxID=445930 RepID=A0ABT9PMH5_9ACTO|nr:MULTISPECIES: DUF3180 domain-containing protein [Trueperella]MCI7305772.1 DUF3180 domain-containing protein [Trueperella sp.]MDP9833150.1 hypothetical protein [Trueperella abortisuis]MDY5403481.1 DUF3180 domain-containing protein [Trueperella sp.]